MTSGPGPDDLPCQQLVELLTEYLEGALDPDTVARVDEHLAMCDGCDTYLDQLRATVSTLGRVPADTLSPDAQAALLEAFRSQR